MAGDVRQTPVFDITQRGDEVLIRTEAEADLKAEDVRVEVHDGVLEVGLPKAALHMREFPTRERRATERVVSGREEGAQVRATGQAERRDRSHPSGTAGAEPPLGVPDERDMWAAQRPLISEDRRTSLHLEGFSDEQANDVMEAVGEDAAEEAQGGSATGSDVFPAHGGFPSEHPETDEEQGS